MHFINLGGEGEIPNVINQQPLWVESKPNWRSSRHGLTINELKVDGHRFEFCSNDHLSFADNSVSIVYTNHVRIGGKSHLGPWVPESEIWRILANGGLWYHNGILKWVKPWVVSLN